MHVVIVGTGRIGCGYLAPLFAQAGWRAVLAARTEQTRDRIAVAGGFRAVIVGESSEHRDEHQVRGFDVVAVGSPDWGDAVVQADLICVSVGVGKVASVGAPLAAALSRRRRPVDVWVVENADVAPRLEAAVQQAAAEAGLDLPAVGFAGGVASVAVARGGWHPGSVAEFVGDSTRTLAVDGSRILATVPGLPGVRETRHYWTRLREKLFVFNAGHAMAAYLGWLRGHATVAEAVADPFLRPIVAGCMLESRRALVAAHPELAGDVEGPVSDALRRFASPALADPVTRVARDPIRKLRADDRLLGPVAVMRRITGTVPAYFALGVAGALLYRGPADAEAEQLDEHLRTEGVMAVLKGVCGLAPDDPFARAVAARYRGFAFGDGETLFPPVHAGELVALAAEGV